MWQAEWGFLCLKIQTPFCTPIKKAPENQRLRWFIVVRTGFEPVLPG